jgi:hypothetical protein
VIRNKILTKKNLMNKGWRKVKLCEFYDDPETRAVWAWVEMHPRQLGPWPGATNIKGYHIYRFLTWRRLQPSIQLAQLLTCNKTSEHNT